MSELTDLQEEQATGPEAPGHIILCPFWPWKLQLNKLVANQKELVIGEHRAGHFSVIPVWNVSFRVCQTQLTRENLTDKGQFCYR